MTSAAKTVEAYLKELPPERADAMRELRRVVSQNLPKGFAETMSYGMIGYVVPQSLYPAGYHCNPKLPLPFINLASQKQFIAVYHMGIYAMPELLAWFQTEWNKAATAKLDMGKSCIRFKHPEQIPYKLIGQLARKVTTKKWIEHYEAHLAPKPKANRLLKGATQSRRAKPANH